MIDDDKNIGPAGLLELCGVCLTLDRTQLFEKLDVAVPAGDVVTIMGPSGCGKSSLWAIICGTLPPVFGASGEARLDGFREGHVPRELLINKFGKELSDEIKGKLLEQSLRQATEDFDIT